MPYSPNKIEAGLFRYIQSEQCQTVRTGAVGAALGLSPARASALLSGMDRRGIIARVRAGLYLVPAAPPRGQWCPGEALALLTLMADCGGQYQICGLNTFNRYGWDEQVPNSLCVYNDRLSGERRIGAVTLTLIKVPAEQLGSVEVDPVWNGAALRYSSRARALTDAVCYWSRFFGLPRAYDWIRKELRAGTTEAEELVELSARYGTQAGRRRMGLALEEAGAAERVLAAVEQSLSPGPDEILRVPFLPSEGPLNKRWGVRINYE